MSEPVRRTVRATPGFFTDLDRQLPTEAGPDGVPPSRGDFQTYDLLLIVERFATGFDDLPQPIPGRPDYRILITEVIPVGAWWSRCVMWCGRAGCGGGRALLP